MLLFAKEFPGMKLESDSNAMPGKISHRSDVTTMNTAGWVLAQWANRSIGNSFDN
jgi:hypothetical protein